MDKATQAKQTNIKLVIETETNQKFKVNVLPECPFCGSGTGKNGTSAFSIHPKRNIFTCFSCDATGNPIEFIINHHPGFSDKQAINYIVEKFPGQYQEEKIPVATPSKPDDSLRKTFFAIKNNALEPAKEYLRNRGINIDLLPPGSYYFDSIEKAVVFVDSDKILINKRLFEPKNGQKSKFVKGSTIKNALYDCIFKSNLDTVYITEGVINTLSLFPDSAIAIFTTANQFTDKEKLSRYITNKRIILAFDGDQAGNKCTAYYLKFIRESGIEVKSIYRLLLTTNQDVNDLLQKGSLSDFLADTANFETLWENTEHIDILMKPISRDSENPDLDFKTFHFFKRDGRYFVFEGNHKAKTGIAISNFLMEILYHFVDGSNNTRRLIKIQRYTNELITVEVLSSEMKPDNFKTILKSQNCSFLGNAFQLESIFMVLMDDQREAFAIEMLGYIPEFEIYAFSDCILNKNNNLVKVNRIGIATDENKSFYLPAFAQNNINNVAYNNTRKFRYKEGVLTFQEWAKLIYQAYGVNGSISICFLINSLFRDIVFYETGFMPFLYLFGQPGVGKSSFIDFFLRLFGEKEIGISIKNSNTKGIARSLSQKRNSLIFLKEYENTIDREMIALLKNAYDGAAYTIAQKSTDNKTHSFLIESALIIDGNVLPTAESALFDRMIVLHFETHSFTEEETNAYKRLVDESEKGLGQIIKEILGHRETFKANFKNDFRDIYNEIKYTSLDYEGFSINMLPERTIRHIAFLLTPFKTLQEKLSFPFDFSELVKKIVLDSIEKFQMLNDIKDVSVFWDAISWERNKEYSGIQEGRHYVKDEAGKVLYIKFPSLFPYYMQYCKLNNLQYIDKTSLLSLLTSKSYPPFIEGKQKGRNKFKSISKYGFGECYMFLFELSNESNSIKISGKEIYL
jgi:hypothetical protein